MGLITMKDDPNKDAPGGGDRRGAKATFGDAFKGNTENTSAGSAGKAPGAVVFLQRLRPGGPWVLTAIAPDGPTETITTQDASVALQFVAKHNGQRNLYYAVNPLRGPVTKKAAKTDVAAIEYLFADLDPQKDESPEAAKARYLELLNTFEPKATAVIDSGNGIQAEWQLRTRIPLGEPVNGKFSDEDQSKIDDVEARTKAIMLRLGAPAGTQNIDRILRLPGTTNLPNAKKRKSGRVPCPAVLLEFNGGTHALEDFPKAEEKPRAEDPKAKHVKGIPNNVARALYIADRGAGVSVGGYAGRSELFFGFLIDALRSGADDEALIEACLNPKFAGMAIYEHIQDQKGDDAENYVGRQIEHAANKIEDDQGNLIKITIRVRPGFRHEIWRAVARALRQANCPVFVRGGALVEPLWRWEKSEGDNRGALVAKFVRYDLWRLSDMVARHAVIFQRRDKKEKKWLPMDPPKDAIQTLLHRGDWDNPTVRGIVNAPTMRPDGSLLFVPGYDPATELWYKPAGDLELPPIPERPTKADAKAALKLLTDLLAGFPLEEDIDKSVALAAILTVVLRGAFEIAPLFFFLAPEAGTGKTFLIFLIATIATGRRAVPLPGTDDPKEMEKRLQAAAIEGKPILFLNNLVDDLESGLLSQMVTDGTIDVRPYGKNDVLIPCDCRGMTAFANGNNIRVVGDLVRRTLTSHLNANMEEPETRTFDFDPIDKVKANRGAYLAAVFTIVRAYMAAGCPKQDAEAFAGFDPWSRMVRLPLMWLGLKDPVSSTKEARLLDPQRGDLRERIGAYVKHMGVRQPFTAAALTKKAMETTSGARGIVPAYPELFEALSRDGRSVTVKSVTRKLTADLKRICSLDGKQYRVVLATRDRKTANTYRVELVKAPQTVVPPEEAAM